LRLCNNEVVMDLNAMWVFHEVVSQGSFTAAAKRLGMRKSTVSRKITALEDRLGARLLHRTTRRLSLTETGRAYFDRCARVMAEVEAADREVADLHDAPRGKLRITAPVDIGLAFVGPLAADFLERYPEVHLEVVLTGRVVDLVAEGFDVAIRAGSLADSSLIARRLGTTGGRLYASSSYAQSHVLPKQPEQLVEHACITSTATGFGDTWQLNSGERTVRVAVAGRLRVNDFGLARKAVLAGHGIAFIPEVLCVDDVASGRLVPVLPAWQSRASGVWAVYPSTRNLSAKVRAFLDFLRDEMSPPPWERVAARERTAVSGGQA